MSTVWFLSLFVVLGAVGGISVVLGGRSELLDETTDRRLQSLRKELLGARNYANDAKDEAGKSRSLTDLLEALDEETELTQKKSNTDEKAVKDDSNDDDDDDDNDDDGDEIDGSDVSDGIFYFAANLADEIKATCDIDIAAIFSGYSPATLTAANDANTKLGAATKDLSDVLTANPGFAKDLKAFADSSTFKASDVSANLDKTFANIEKTLSSVRDKLFCAEAQLIATRLQMSLYGGVGFANGYLCNKVFVELIRYDLNATRLLEASTDEEDFVRNCTRNLVDDITCYEKELEAYNKIIPTAAYTAASPLQTAAFTADFLVGYGVVLMYHSVILSIEADIVKLCAECKDQKEKEIQNEEEEEEDKEEVETPDEDTESLTNQLQKLLRKLNEVSAKKKEAQKPLSGGTGFHANDKVSAADGRSGVREPVQSENEDLEAAMPSTGEKTAIKKSYYREREN